MPIELSQHYEDWEERIRSSFEGMVREIWFAMPVSVTEDSDGKTVKLQPLIKQRWRDKDGKHEWKELPVLESVPVHFTGGGGDKEGKGGWTMTHPVTKGDEGMMIVSSRAIDNWFEKGDVQEPVDNRYHHLSDAKYIPGLRSKKRELKNIATKTVQLRSDDEGDDKKPKHVFDIDHKNGVFTHSVDSGKHTITIDQKKGITHKSSVKVHIEADKITSKGTWNHKGGLRASETIQSDVGLKAPQFEGAPGSPPDVAEYTDS